MKAEQLKQIDLDYRNHLQAFLNFAVKAEKKSGKKSKPVYSKFKQFYNYEKELDKALNKKESKSRFDGLTKFFTKEV
jgi:hypothetical protein